MNLRQEFLAILDALAQARLAYGVCDAFAVGPHGYPRMTTDIEQLRLDSGGGPVEPGS